MKNIFFLTLIIFIFQYCIEPKNPYPSLAPGIWRGVLNLNPEPKLSLKDEIDRYEKDKTRPINDIESDLPFLFEIKYQNEKPYIEIINAEERIRLEDVRVARNRSTAEDTVFIDFPIFDSHIRAILKEGILQGDWTVRSKVNYSIPFTARFGKNQRFDVVTESPASDMSGNWSCIFDADTKNPYPAVGELKQSGNMLSGTFRTETGDYRYLEGTVNGNKFYLSCFDGAHAFLFFGKVTGDSLIGTFKSGKSAPSYFEGIKNNNARLTDAVTLNKATGTPVSFSFLDQNGNTKTLKEYTKDIKIIQIMGTWCPNCYDETRFITSYLKAHPDQSIDVIALACERYRDTAKSLASIKNYKNRMNMPYDILLASTSTNKAETSKQLPFIDTILSYPTMIVLDKKNTIQFIHTGIDGPATSKYKDFVKDFEDRIAQILKTKI